jgi:hypothetical protein
VERDGWSAVLGHKPVSVNDWFLPFWSLSRAKQLGGSSVSLYLQAVREAHRRMARAAAKQRPMH